MTHSLFSISPIDGRYTQKTRVLRDYFSEGALQKYRIRIEIEWFIYLSNTLKLKGTRKLSNSEITRLRDLYLKFTEKNAEEIKKIESTTNHDVKAIEYYIKSALKTTKLKAQLEFIHFGCTSEDINNLAHALMLKEYMEQVHIDKLCEIADTLRDSSIRNAQVPMLSHTHGQPASPTTIGKESFVFVRRLDRQLKFAMTQDYLGKFNGAVGNFNAHYIAYPKIDWMRASEDFVTKLGLTHNPMTTQIESHDYMAELFDTMRRINTILIDLSRDMWSYIGKGYFKQGLKKGEIGSSTMPHKVNPIDFENCEGNMGLANAMFGHLSEKLPISRMQRDLTDSTVLRNMGVAFAYTYIGLESLLKGLSKVEINNDVLKTDLENHMEILAEPIQTVMRTCNIPNPYEKLKELTRGKHMTLPEIQQFIKSLKLDKVDEQKLLKLTPAKYIGLAPELIKKYNA